MSEPQKNIESSVIDELSQRNSALFMPILIDIRHSGIIWQEGSNQKNGHLRLVCNTEAIRYKGDDDIAYLYEPCTFIYKAPKEDGKTKGTASITISCIDSRIIEIIRGITEGLTCKVVALFTKVKDENNEVNYTFSKFYGKTFELGSVSWSGDTAQWALEQDSTLSISYPKDKGSRFRCPSVVTED